MTQESTNSRKMFKKGLFIILAVLVLQIPVLLINGLIIDREDILDKTEEEISKQWGGKQTIYAPEIRLPYMSAEIDANGQRTRKDNVRTIQPVSVEVTGNVNVETRNRSIYEVPVYQTDLKIEGKFELAAADIDCFDGKAYLYLPIGETRGIEDNIIATVDGKEYSFELSENGLRIQLQAKTLREGQVINYSIDLKTRGAEKLSFKPRAELFKVNLRSNYPSPGFNGAFLPTDRNVTEDGFEAEWVVTEFNTFGVYNSEFYVELVVPVSQYQQTTRATKYSFLIILLVLVAIFLVETITRQDVSYVQYIVTGLSLCLFYLLLLSISEYMAFSWAYLIASGMTVAALGGYFIGFLRSHIAVFCTIAVAVLYAFIYVLLNLETGSLLVGSLALFVILSIIMYFTRKSNFADSTDTPPSEIQA